MDTEWPQLIAAERSCCSGGCIHGEHDKVLVLIALGPQVSIRHTPHCARLMIPSLSCQEQSITAPLTSIYKSFRSTQRFQTPSRPPRTRKGRPTSSLRNNRRFKSFCPLAALSEATDIMPEASTDLLFAAAMPKEEIGALDFLKVFGATLC